MKRNKLAASLMALSAPLMMTAISTPAANAVDVESTVSAIDVCAWQMSGGPTELALEPANPDTKYKGAALEVSDSFNNLILGLSGAQSVATATEGTSTECSFYNQKKTAAVTIELTGTGTFTATYGSGIADTNMDFDLDETHTLDLAADIASCTGWESDAVAFQGVTAPTSLFDLPSVAVETEYAGGSGERCAPTVTVSVEIPASTSVPAGAGQDYNFSGPSIVIAKSVTNVG